MFDTIVVFIGAGGKMYKQMKIDEARQFIKDEEAPANGWEIIVIEKFKQTYRGPLEKSPVYEVIAGERRETIA